MEVEQQHIDIAMLKKKKKVDTSFSWVFLGAHNAKSS